MAPFRAGRIAFGIAILLFGVEHLVRGHLVPGLPPLPPFLPQSRLLALSLGIGLIVAGTLLLAKASLRAVALVTGYLLLLAACLHLMHLHATVLEGSPRTVFLEALALGASALALAGEPRGMNPRSPESSPVAVARIVYALTMVIFGVQHFQYLSFVATLVPAWIPNHRAWVIATGIALVAAGIALLARVASRAAAYGLALMFFSWLALLHLPRIIDHPHNGDEWASGLVVLALGGGALALAAVVPDRMSRR